MMRLRFPGCRTAIPAQPIAAVDARSTGGCGLKCYLNLVCYIIETAITFR
jgi:hypothetical protein